MRGHGFVLGCCLTVFGHVAMAHVYPLQFTPNSGYRNLVVAGYAFSGSTVVGNCSYQIAHSGSGKGGGYKTTITYYNQTCTWDLFGNLESIAQGAPVAPAPVYTSGTQTVYAVSGSDTTGYDPTVGHGGFVSTPGSHYTWVTSNVYTVLQQQLYSMSIVLQSDGDIPLTVTAADVSAVSALTGVIGTTCVGQIPVGGTCTVVVKYDPTKLKSVTGLAYDTLTVSITSDAGQVINFVQGYTIVLKYKADD